MGAGGCASEVAQTCGWQVDAGCGQEASVLTTGLLKCPHGHWLASPSVSNPRGSKVEAAVSFITSEDKHVMSTVFCWSPR